MLDATRTPCGCTGMKGISKMNHNLSLHAQLALMILYCNGGEMESTKHRKEFDEALAKFPTVKEAIEHYRKQAQFLPKPDVRK